MRTDEIGWVGRSGILLLLGFVAATPAAAVDLDGFFAKKGHVDLALSYTAESYDSFWVGDQEMSDPGLGEVSTTTYSIWARWGLTPKLTLIGNVPYVDTEGDGTAGFAESGMQDLELYGQYLLGTLGSNVQNSFVVAAGLRTPLSDYESNAPVALGDDTTDGLARFVYQLKYRAFHLSQQIGYDLRGGDAPDGYPLYTQAGYSLKRVIFYLTYSKLISADAPDIGDPGFTFSGDKEEYDRAGLKVFVRLGERFGLSLAGYDTLEGHNTGKSSGGSLGLVCSF